MRKTTWVRLSLVFLAGLALVVLLQLTTAEEAPITVQQPEPTEQAPSPSDLLRVQRSQLDSDQNRSSVELLDFAIWLADNDVDGFIGEAAWPGNAARQSEALLWLDIIDSTNIPFTAWAAGHNWPASYKLLFFIDSEIEGDQIDSTTSQSRLLTNRFAQTDLDWGVNLAGLEFGANADGYSAQNPGILGESYFSEPEESYSYLASQGVKVLRLPFAWERLQPELYGPLDQAYLGLITSAIESARANDMQIILDLHSYGRYKKTTALELRLGSSELPYDSLSDVWTKIHQQLGVLHGDAIWAYDIMNEPHDLPNPTQDSPAREWEVGSQQVLDDLRSAGYENRILIPGYEWSKLHRWSVNHPTAWITDPIDNFVYEAHHYWDDSRQGTYDND